MRTQRTAPRKLVIVTNEDGWCSGCGTEIKNGRSYCTECGGQVKN